MENIIDLLHSGGYSCVIQNGTEIRTFTQRGVADLYNLLQHDAVFMKGAYIADKVIGKAAAALMILGGMEQVYADVISLSAFELFQRTKVKVNFVRIVPFIENRDKSGWCPMEKISFSVETPEEILPLVREFIDSIKHKDTSK